MSHGGGHLGWHADFLDTNFKRDHLRTIVTKLVPIGPVVSKEKSDKVFPIGYYVKRSHTVVAILDGVRTCRNQFFKENHPRTIVT